MDDPVTSEPQVCGAISVSGKRHATILDNIGAAFLSIKHQRGLTLAQMADDLRKSDDTIARIISGEVELGVVTWLRACDEYPELPSRVAETAAERELKAKQQAFDLNPPRQRERAA